MLVPSGTLRSLLPVRFHARHRPDSRVDWDHDRNIDFDSHFDKQAGGRFASINIDFDISYRSVEEQDLPRHITQHISWQEDGEEAWSAGD